MTHTQTTDAGIEPFDAPTLRLYFSGPAGRAQIEAEGAADYARANAAIDEGMRRARERKALTKTAD